MAQTTRDSTVAVQTAEDLYDVFSGAIADGAICDIEVARIKRGIKRVKKATVISDTATALSVNVGRGGLDGDRFIELSNDYRRLKAAFHSDFDDAA